MNRTAWLGAGLMALGAGIAATALLGPLVTGVIRYRTSPTTLNQIIGGDAGALAVAVPVAFVAAVLALRRHPAAAAVGLAPAVFALYTTAQLVVGQEYLRLPGNNERFFPLLLAVFVVAGAVAVTAWHDTEPIAPPPSRRLRLTAAVTLLAVASFLALGLHLPTLADAWAVVPTRVGYVSSPTPFWLVKLMDLGIVVPLAAAAAVGLLRHSAGSGRLAVAVLGGYTLLGASVTGMAVTMLARHDPDASWINAVAFATFTVALAALASALMRPLSQPA